MITPVAYQLPEEVRRLRPPAWSSCPFPSPRTRRSCYIPLTGQRSSSRSSLNLDSWYPRWFTQETSISRGRGLTMMFLYGSPKDSSWITSHTSTFVSQSLVWNVNLARQLGQSWDSLFDQLHFSCEKTRKRLLPAKVPEKEILGVTAILVKELSGEAAVAAVWSECDGIVIFREEQRMA